MKIWDSVYISTSYIRRRGLNQFSDKSKNAIGIDGIWTRGCSVTSDAANPPATVAGSYKYYKYNYQKRYKIMSTTEYFGFAIINNISIKLPAEIKFGVIG